MARVGKPLTGVGKLIVGEREFAGVRYRIEVHKDLRDLLQGVGHLTMPIGSAHALTSTYSESGAVLVTTDGHRLTIVPGNSSMLDGTLTFTVSGPVPGFG